jgi:hypothetical protein
MTKISELANVVERSDWKTASQKAGERAETTRRGAWRTLSGRAGRCSSGPPHQLTSGNPFLSELPS